MNKRVLESLQFANNLPKLKGYFDKEPFIKIKFHEESKEAIMMDSGYTHNLSTKFWRVLKTIELIIANRTNIQMSNYLLEVFTNQCLSFTDILATWVNHFLKLGLSGTKLSTHNEKFVKCLQDQITDDKIKSLVEDFFSWSKIKLYPYRNIIHHMGELSGGVSMDLSFVAVPKTSEWDFVKMREDLKGYPSQTAFQIATNTIKVPNILTGDPGDSHKYESIVDFSNEWLNTLYSMACTFVEIVIEKKNGDR